MSIHLRCLVLVILLFTSTNALFAQTKNDKPATASVTGRITFNNQPLAGITVSLEMPMNLGVGVANSQRQPITTKTDANGYYRLQGIAAGYYLVWPRALAYVMSVEGLSGHPGRTVNLSDGEAVEGLDFALVKGGVISGKITDHLGRPVVLQRVNLRRYTIGNETAQFLFPSTNLTIFETDDRGVYRLFGLPAGRYNVSVGGDRSGQVGEAYGRTFYPGRER